jgi:hypothetical protein
MEDLTALRDRMLNELPSKGDAPVDIETDHEQVTDNEDENVSQMSDSDEELDTPFPLLSDKMIHIIAYGWENHTFDDLDIISALESLRLPMQSRLEPRTVNGVPLVVMILTCLDTYTWSILEKRAAWIKLDDTHVFVAFRISVGSKAVNGKHHAWIKFTSRTRRNLAPRDFPYHAEKCASHYLAHHASQ